MTTRSLPFEVVRLDRPAVPPWLDHWLCRTPVERSSSRHEEISISVSTSQTLSLIEAVVSDAGSMNIADFEQAVTDVYRLVSELLPANKPLYPWRFWNYVPRIVEPLPDGRNWYMAFNAGRYEAYRQWHGDAFQPQLTAASAVGHRGNDLHLHVLAGPRPGYAIENPRQRSAYRYSEKYGPLPPCFARATLVQSDATSPCRVVVAGTASILGEDTMHVGDTHKQMHETARNLAAVISDEALDAAKEPGLCPGAASYDELRAYVVEESDEEMVLETIARLFPRVQRVELMPADLCRPELLIEIDGLASFDSATAGSIEDASRAR